MAAFNAPASNFNAYAAGNKIYGMGRTNPTNGPVDPLGYKERDAATKLKRAAIMRRLKAQQSGNYMSADWLGGSNGYN